MFTWLLLARFLLSVCVLLSFFYWKIENAILTRDTMHNYTPLLLTIHFWGTHGGHKLAFATIANQIEVQIRAQSKNSFIGVVDLVVVWCSNQDQVWLGENAVLSTAPVPPSVGSGPRCVPTLALLRSRYNGFHACPGAFAIHYPKLMFYKLIKRGSEIDSIWNEDVDALWVLFFLSFFSPSSVSCLLVYRLEPTVGELHQGDGRFRVSNFP